LHVARLESRLDAGNEFADYASAKRSIGFACIRGDSRIKKKGKTMADLIHKQEVYGIVGGKTKKAIRE